VPLPSPPVSLAPTPLHFTRPPRGHRSLVYLTPNLEARHRASQRVVPPRSISLGRKALRTFAQPYYSPTTSQFCVSSLYRTTNWYLITVIRYSVASHKGQTLSPAWVVGSYHFLNTIHRPSKPTREPSDTVDQLPHELLSDSTSCITSAPGSFSQTTVTSPSGRKCSFLAFAHRIRAETSKSPIQRRS
jgi:hypothetical protein